MTPAKRKELCRRGKRGDIARAVVDAGEDRVIAYYRDGDGLERKVKFADTKAGRGDAIRFVEGWHAEREEKTKAKALAASTPATVTIRDLFVAFKAAEFSEFEGEGLRAATQVSYAQHWNRFELHFGIARSAVTIKKHEVDEFVKAERATKRALNQIRQTLNVVRLVFRWGIEHEFLTHSPLAVMRWKKRNDAQKPLEPGEFTTAEFELMLAQLDKDDARQWRGWVFLMLVGHHGQRARTVLHLRWQDIDFAKGVIVWPAKYQKQGKDFVQPILWETLSALKTAGMWRQKAATFKVQSHHKTKMPPAQRLLEADWVIFAERDKAKPISYASAHYHLREAMKRAGMDPKDKPYVSAHGFRRMVVGNVIDATGDRLLGLEYVGDTDVKMLKSYDRRRAQRVEAASATIGGECRRVAHGGTVTETESLIQSCDAVAQKCDMDAAAPHDRLIPLTASAVAHLLRRVADHLRHLERNGYGTR